MPDDDRRPHRVERRRAGQLRQDEVEGIEGIGRHRVEQGDPDRLRRFARRKVEAAAGRDVVASSHRAGVLRRVAHRHETRRWPVERYDEARFPHRAVYHAVVDRHQRPSQRRGAVDDRRDRHRVADDGICARRADDQRECFRPCGYTPARNGDADDPLDDSRVENKHPELIVALVAACRSQTDECPPDRHRSPWVRFGQAHGEHCMGSGLADDDVVDRDDARHVLSWKSGGMVRV